MASHLRKLRLRPLELRTDEIPTILLQAVHSDTGAIMRRLTTINGDFVQRNPTPPPEPFLDNGPDTDYRIRAIEPDNTAWLL